MSKLDFPSLIITVLLCCLSIYAYYKLNLDIMAPIGNPIDPIRVLAVVLIIGAVFMIIGCILKYAGYTKEELDAIADDAGKNG